MVDLVVVSKLAATMAKDRAIEMITSASVFAADDDIANPNMVKVVLDRAGNGLYFSRSPIPFVRDVSVAQMVASSGKLRHSTLNSQLSTHRFLRHQGIYGYTTKFLLQFVKWKPGILEQAESLEQLRALENGAKIRVVLARHAAVSVDTLENVRTVESLLAS